MDEYQKFMRQQIEKDHYIESKRDKLSKYEENVDQNRSRNIDTNKYMLWFLLFFHFPTTLGGHCFVILLPCMYIGVRLNQIRLVGRRLPHRYIRHVGY